MAPTADNETKAKALAGPPRGKNGKFAMTFLMFSSWTVLLFRRLCTVEH